MAGPECSGGPLKNTSVIQDVLGAPAEQSNLDFELPNIFTSHVFWLSILIWFRVIKSGDLATMFLGLTVSEK
jgi:hypothetical protein